MLVHLQRKRPCHIGIAVGDVIAAVSLFHIPCKPVFVCIFPETAAACTSLCLEIVVEVLGFSGESCKQLGRFLVERLLCNHHSLLWNITTVDIIIKLCLCWISWSLFSRIKGSHGVLCIITHLVFFKKWDEYKESACVCVCVGKRKRLDWKRTLQLLSLYLYNCLWIKTCKTSS